MVGFIKDRGIKAVGAGTAMDNMTPIVYISVQNKPKNQCLSIIV